METSTLSWILLFPLIGILVTALARNGLPRKVLGWFASLMVAGSFWVTLSALGGLGGGEGGLHQLLFVWGSDALRLDFGLMADQLTLWWLLIVTGVGFLIHVYSIEYMAEEDGYGRYFAELNYFIFAMSLLVLADNFVGLLLGWANVGLASFLLIGFWNRKPEALAAARKALVINIMGEVAMVVAVALIFVQFKSFQFADVFSGVAAADAGLLTGIGLLLLVGILTKSAQFPLHVWLPDAMQGPTPVSALIHAATMVTAGVYLVARAYPLFSASPAVMETIAIIGALSTFLGALWATRQFDIKRVLAYSTLSQLGYMFLGIGAGVYTASVFHFFTHAFFKALLFLGAGVITHYLHGEQDIRKMGGLGRRLPFAYWTFLAGVLAIAGAPPFAGFFSKDEILAGLLADGRIGLWLVGVVSAGLTAYYMARLFALVFAGEPAEQQAAGAGDAHHGAEGHKSGIHMNLPVAVLAVLSVIGGFMVSPGRFLEPVLTTVGAHEAGGSAGSIAAVLILSAIGFVVGIALFGPKGAGRRAAFRTGGRPVRGPVSSAFFLDELYLWLVGLVGGGAKRSIQTLQSGYIRRYALTLFAGFAAFLFYYILV